MSERVVHATQYRMRMAAGHGWNEDGSDARRMGEISLTPRSPRQCRAKHTSNRGGGTIQPLIAPSSRAEEAPTLRAAVITLLLCGRAEVWVGGGGDPLRTQTHRSYRTCRQRHPRRPRHNCIAGVGAAGGQAVGLALGARPTLALAVYDCHMHACQLVCIGLVRHTIGSARARALSLSLAHTHACETT